MDDLLVEWRADTTWGDGGKNPSKSQYEKAIASIEKFYPPLKGNLLYARAVLSSWKVVTTPHHTVPMSRPFAMLLSCWLSQHGLARMGATLLLQYLQCLRPSEALQMHAFVLPEEYPPAQGSGVIFLGVKTGTKAGRPQITFVRDPIALLICRRWRKTLVRGDRLATHRSLSIYAHFICQAAQAYGYGDVGWTPHSPRAGFASDSAIANKPFVETREAGRWVSDKSLRTYLDIMAVMGGQLASQLTSWLPLADAIEEDFEKYFRWW